MLVSELMNKNVVSISQDEPTARAARLLFRHNIGAIPVCGDKGKLRGIVTDRDIVLRCVASQNDPDVTAVREVMSRAIVTVAPSDDVSVAAQKMSDAQVRRLPVVDNGRLVGMLSLGDIARKKSFDMEAAQALSEISSNIHRL